MRRGLAGAVALSFLATGLAACQSESDGPGDDVAGASEGASQGAEQVAEVEAKVVTSVGPRRRAVPIDHDVTVSAEHALLSSVDVKSSAGDVTGRLSADKREWTATGRLEPGTDYVVRAVAESSDGQRVTRTSRFHTEDLTLDEQTYASVAPLQGETVGVGMPVIVTFDVPVTDKASIERHMSVRATPSQQGSWHWLSDHEVHWRPKSYWKAGTDVSVDVDINSVPAGDGVYGQESREVSFHVGDSVVSKVNADTDQMRTFINGKLAKTTPITTGKPGFTTRSGVKVIIEKFRHKRMNSETVGINRNSPEAYDIDDVEYAMRVTYSGEFLHAAPWSVSSQGRENVSHGCTGMSTANAAWLYNISKRGDVVEYTGTDRPMSLTNGYGDWNESFAEYAQGSALH